MERRGYNMKGLRGELKEKTYNKVYAKYIKLVTQGKTHREAVLECQKSFGYAQPNAVYKIVKIKQSEHEKNSDIRVCDNSVNSIVS